MSTVTEWKLLVVEDEIDGQDVVAGLLEAFNVEAYRAFTAEEGLKMLAENHFDGAIIDIGLPGMDGWELIKRIRSNAATASLPCVAITAFHTSTVRHQALTSGFNGYIPKPLDEISFIRDVRTILSNGS